MGTVRNSLEMLDNMRPEVATFSSPLDEPRTLAEGNAEEYEKVLLADISVLTFTRSRMTKRWAVLQI